MDPIPLRSSSESSSDDSDDESEMPEKEKDPLSVEMIRDNDGYDVATQLGFQKLSGQFFPICRMHILSMLS